MRFFKLCCSLTAIVATGWLFYLWIDHDTKRYVTQLSIENDFQLVISRTITGSNGLPSHHWRIGNKIYEVKMSYSYSPGQMKDMVLAIYSFDGNPTASLDELWHSIFRKSGISMPLIKEEIFEDKDLDRIVERGLVFTKYDGSTFFDREKMAGDILGIRVEEIHDKFYRTEASDDMQSRYIRAIYVIAKFIRDSEKPR